MHQTLCPAKTKLIVICPILYKKHNIYNNLIVSSILATVPFIKVAAASTLAAAYSNSATTPSTFPSTSSRLALKKHMFKKKLIKNNNYAQHLIKISFTHITYFRKSHQMVWRTKLRKRLRSRRTFNASKFFLLPNKRRQTISL